MPQKGWEKGGGVWGGEKAPFLKRVFSPPQVPTFIGNRAKEKRASRDIMMKGRSDSAIISGK